MTVGVRRLQISPVFDKWLQTIFYYISIYRWKKNSIILFTWESHTQYNTTYISSSASVSYIYGLVLASKPSCGFFQASSVFASSHSRQSSKRVGRCQKWGRSGWQSFEDAPVSFKSDARKHFGFPVSRRESGEKVTGRKKKKTHCADTARQWQ